jgi:hypothetical protein
MEVKYLQQARGTYNKAKDARFVSSPQCRAKLKFENLDGTGGAGSVSFRMLAYFALRRDHKTTVYNS